MIYHTLIESLLLHGITIYSNGYNNNPNILNIIQNYALETILHELKLYFTHREMVVSDSNIRGLFTKYREFCISAGYVYSI